MDVDFEFEQRDPNQFTVLTQEFSKLKKDYDAVICDCPPNLYTMTQNTLYACDHYLVPTIPDYLSATGLPLLLARVDTMATTWRRRLPCIGIMYTKVRPGPFATLTQQRRMETIRGDPAVRRRGISVFSVPVHEYEDVRRSEETKLPLAVYNSSSTVAREFSQNTSELIGRLEAD